MKDKLYIIVVLLLFSIITLPQSVFSQQGTKTIIDDINTRKVGQGDVRIMQDETIDDSLAQYHVNSDTSSVIRLTDERVHGYKIQVFSGNNQNKSRNEAEQKQSQVRAGFPEHQAVITYDPPNWRLRVGNFLTKQEAEEVLVRMKETFPGFGKEMYVVNDIIRRPLH